MYDLPSEFSEEPGLPDEFHDLQPQLLSRTLSLVSYSRDSYFTGSDLNVYYDVKHSLWHKRPDWFLALDVPRLYDGQELRRSYVTWQEGQNPYIIVELLSPGTEAEDLGRFYSADRSANTPAKSRSDAAQLTSAPPSKFEVYERYLRVPHYVVYSRYNQELRYFKLTGGRYEEQPLNRENPQIWLTDIETGLGIWAGEFEGVLGHWLRWCDRQGEWRMTDTEQIQAQLIQAAQNLLATGMAIEQVISLLNLSEEQIQLLRN